MSSKFTRGLSRLDSDSATSISSRSSSFSSSTNKIPVSLRSKSPNIKRKSYLNNITADTNPENVSNDTIKVICRFRPLRPSIPRPESRSRSRSRSNTTSSTSSSNTGNNSHTNPHADALMDIFSISTDTNTVEVSSKIENIDTRKFAFDRIFGPQSTQKDIFHQVEGVVDSVLSGFNGAILAYGQTASGKSYTMEGPSLTDNNSQGITSRVIEKLFLLISLADENIQFQIIASYVEVYCEKLRDLLNPQQDNMKIRESRNEGFIVQDLTEVICKDKDSVLRVLELGKANRVSAPTLMNAESSRSHSIFSLNVIQKSLETGRKKKGRLYLVDLAGSEKVGKTGAAGVRLEEAKNINSSLTTLGMVINALCEGQTHVPYRDSKLTKVLMDTLGGNSKTILIICCATEIQHVPETMSSLRFGERAKKVKNVAIVNEEISIEELKSMLAEAKREISILKARIQTLEGNKKDRESRESSIESDSDTLPLPPISSPAPPRYLSRALSATSASIVMNVEEVLKMTDDEWKLELFEPLNVANEKISKLESENSMLLDDLDEEKARADQERNMRVHLESEVNALNGTIEELEEKLHSYEHRSDMNGFGNSVNNGKGDHTKNGSFNKESNGKSNNSNISQLYDLMEGVMSSLNISATSSPSDFQLKKSYDTDKDSDYELVEASRPLDMAEKYSRLKEDFEVHLERLSAKLADERDARLIAEMELEKAMAKLHSVTGNRNMSLMAQPPSTTNNILSFLTNPLAIQSPEMRRDNLQMTMALETSQARVVELIKELESTKEAHAMVLESKESVYRQLIRQNAALTSQRDALSNKLDQLNEKTEQLTNLLRSFQNTSLALSSIRFFASENSNTIHGGKIDPSNHLRSREGSADTSVDGM